MKKTEFSLGLIGASFGLEGFVKVKSFSGETEHFSKLDIVTLRKDGKEESRKAEEIMLKGKNLLIRFSGINNPEEAALLTGAEIIAGRQYASALGENEYYVDDLIDMDVMDAERKKLGKILNVIDGGGGNLLHIALITGEERYAPFRKEFFHAPDFENNSIILTETWVLE